MVGLLTKDDVRLLTLTGPGGTGKTRLALQAAAQASESFPDGVYWVLLAPLREPALILSSLARALAVRRSRDAARGHALGAPVKQEPASPPRQRRAPATGRGRAHRRSAHLERLTPAGDEPSDCVSAASRPAGAAARGRRRDGVARRTRTSNRSGIRCIPWSASSAPVSTSPRSRSSLAAARTAVFSAEQLLERLPQRLDLLKGDRDTDPRQQTLRATIEWSHDPGRDRAAAFARLAVFVGGGRYEAAEEVAGVDPDTLQSLLDKSLVRKRDADGGPRYWMLETIREYAVERPRLRVKPSTSGADTRSGFSRSPRRRN